MSTLLFLGLDTAMLRMILLKAKFMLSSINYNRINTVYVKRNSLFPQADVKTESESDIESM